jgi:hypothetical protein
MPFNIFNKLYVAPDYLYDNSKSRIIFSQKRNEGDYLTYDSLNHSGFVGEALDSKRSVYEIIGDEKGKHVSVAHYLMDLHTKGTSAKIYADEESYMPLFFTWLRLAMPSVDPDAAFIVYNVIKQRERLVSPDNIAAKSFMITRVAERETNKTLSKIEFVDQLASFMESDLADQNFYDKVRPRLLDQFSVEVQLASYLSGRAPIDAIAGKLQSIGLKIAYAVLSDIKDYIRENIMTEHVQSLTGINLRWDDQNWEDTIAAKSPTFAFLFDSSIDSIKQESEYRLYNTAQALSWCQWIVDSTDSSGGDIEWYDIYQAAQWVIENADVFSNDVSVRNAQVALCVDRDINLPTTTVIFQNEYLRSKINTFWIEYVYQLSKANDIEGLSKISHS